MAEYHAELALRLTHQDGEVLSAIGETYRALGYYEKAANFYEDMIAKNKDVFNVWPVSLPIMGIAYAQSGQDAKAQAAVQEFEDKFPNDNMGRIWSCVSLGYIELCKRNYEAVAQLHANPPSEYNAICRIIALKKLERLDEAKAEYQRTQENYSTSSLSHYVEHFKTFHIDTTIGKELSETLMYFRKYITH